RQGDDFCQLIFEVPEHCTGRGFSDKQQHQPPHATSDHTPNRCCEVSLIKNTWLNRAEAELVFSTFRNQHVDDVIDSYETKDSSILDHRQRQEIVVRDEPSCDFLIVCRRYENQIPGHELTQLLGRLSEY